MDAKELWIGILDASHIGDIDRVRTLLEAGAKPNSQDVFSGYTPLHHAICSGSVQLVELLLDAGAEIEHSDNTVYQTPLVTAVVAGQAEMVRLLLSRGADPRVALYPDGEPLIDAAQKKADNDIVALLTAAGATNSGHTQSPPAADQPSADE